MRIRGAVMYTLNRQKTFSYCRKEKGRRGISPACKFKIELILVIDPVPVTVSVATVVPVVDAHAAGDVRPGGIADDAARHQANRATNQGAGNRAARGVTHPLACAGKRRHDRN